MLKKLLLPIAVIAAVGFATKAQAQTLGTCTGNLTVSIDGSGTGLPLSATAAVTSSYNGAQISCNLASQGTINDGIITVTAAGGTTPYQYSINGGTTYQASNIFSGLTAGTYTFTVKDASNCVITTTSVTITAPLAIVAGTCTLTEDGCQLNQGSVQVEAGGGTGNLSVSWTASFTSPYTGPAGGTTPLVITDPVGTATGSVTFTGLSGNTVYSFKVTDANGCMLGN